MKTIRWGILGCGNVTEVKSGPGFQKARGSELVAVMRRNGALAEDYAKRHGVRKWYDNADALINDPEVDAVYVATPPGSHLELAEKVAAAGKPCYMEKPMARSFVECQKMVAAFEQAKQPLFVAYYRRAMPRFLKMKEIIDSGQLGRITGCRYRITRPLPKGPSDEWRINAEQAGGGHFLDIGSHVIDFLEFALGNFTEFGGSASSSGAVPVEDAVALHFRTASGVIGSCSWNFAGSTNDELLEFEGTQGRLSSEVFTNTPLKVTRGTETESFNVADPAHVAQPLIQTIVDELLGSGKCPSTGMSGARATQIMDAAISTFYNGRDDAFWKRPQTWRT